MNRVKNNSLILKSARIAAAEAARLTTAHTLTAANGDVITYRDQIVVREWDGRLSLCYVIDVQEDIKNGQPGFDVDNDQDAEYGAGWKYLSQVVARVPAGVPGDWFADFLETIGK